ncbi:unnamed protein product [Effrenium voratum]|uniref:Uncharacterized protein n=1 Tax=Effrenium voratum TaxID=2562239 RepID=A0AA36MKP2_9DINO|nr:unnamed protein product [Effrenium voratum]CAJ1455542.1 unnamed protein product [Effrenium voratum]
MTPRWHSGQVQASGLPFCIASQVQAACSPHEVLRLLWMYGVSCVDAMFALCIFLAKEDPWPLLAGVLLTGVHRGWTLPRSWKQRTVRACLGVFCFISFAVLRPHLGDAARSLAIAAASLGLQALAPAFCESDASLATGGSIGPRCEGKAKAKASAWRKERPNLTKARALASGPMVRKGATRPELRSEKQPKDTSDEQKATRWTFSGLKASDAAEPRRRLSEPKPPDPSGSAATTMLKAKACQLPETRQSKTEAKYMEASVAKAPWDAKSAAPMPTGKAVRALRRHSPRCVAKENLCPGTVLKDAKEKREQLHILRQLPCAAARALPATGNGGMFIDPDFEEKTSQAFFEFTQMCERCSAGHSEAVATLERRLRECRLTGGRK